MIYAAFYDKPGGVVDKAIRLRTFSRFSHCELVVHDRAAGSDVAYSSSLRDGGGVRRTAHIDFSDGWELVPLPWVSPEQIERFYCATQHCKYDLSGVLVGQFLAAKIHNGNRYFCSEWLAAALGMDEPWRYSPGLLYAALTSFNRFNELNDFQITSQHATGETA